MADLVKKVELKVVGDTAEAQAKLDEITLKAEKLRDLNPEIKVKIDNFEASAKLAVLREEIKAAGKEPVDVKLKLNKRSVVETEAEIGFLKKLWGGSSGSGGGLSKAISEVQIPYIPGQGPLAIAGAAAAVATLLPELTALVSGFAAATAGAGAFGLLAHNAFSQLVQDVGQLQSGQEAVQLAQNLEKLYPTPAHLKALDAAKQKLQALTVGMGQDAGPAAKAMQRLGDTWHNLQNAFAPTAFAVLGDAFKVLKDALPAILPMAKAFAGAFAPLLGQLDKFVKSKGFADWLKQFTSLIGPATTAIGHGIGQVVLAVGKLLTVMSKKDVVNGINIAFAVLSGTIRVITGTVRVLMQMWDQTSRAVVDGWHIIRTAGLGAWHIIEGVIHNLVHAYDNVKHAASDAVNWMKSAWDRASRDVRNWVRNVIQFGAGVINWFKALPGKVVGFLASLPGLLFKAGQNIISHLISGIKSMIGAVGSAIGGIVSTIRNFLPFSPAKRGPLSGSGSPDIAGRKIGLMLAGGMRGAVPAVMSSSTALARAAGIGAAGGGSAGGALRLEVTGAGNGINGLFIQWLKEYVRVHGGGGANSVQRALGQTT